MSKRSCFLLLLFFWSKTINAQFSENFGDSDFTSDPTWITANNNDWIINSSKQLQSNDTIANSTFYISTQSLLATNAQWEFYVHLAFNTSSSNYADVYLTSSAADLTQTTTTGYFVRSGTTNDNISLYRKDASTSTILINGIKGVLNHSNNILKIKVTRDTSNKWMLYRDTTASGNSYFNEGNAIDSTYRTSAYFGFCIKQSTARFFKKHYFDDIVVKPFVRDTVPPVIQSISATSANTVDILFNEQLDIASVRSTVDYAINGFNPYSVILDTSNSSLVHLYFTVSFGNAAPNKLIINGVKDVSGNAIKNDTAYFTYFAPYIPQRYDVVIDEIMSDPTPQVGLPNSEWIELKNTSNYAINLKGWTIADLSDTSGAITDHTLQPDSFVIVCTKNAVANMSVFGNTIAVTNFPSLDNNDDELILSDNAGNIIHAVNYSVDWFQNELKQQGGWTLEMIDTKNPCIGTGNWTGSIDPAGGTPGRKNSVDGNNNDSVSPTLLRAYADDNMHVTLVFSEPLNNSTASDISNYSITNGLNVESATPAPPLFGKVNLKLSSPLQLNTIYTVTAHGVLDCTGNLIASKDTAKFGISVQADSFDIVINEILYNPKPNGVDYVELYNRSNKILDLKNVFIANKNSTGTISSITSLSSDHYLLFPQEFIVATANPGAVRSQYIALNPDAFITVNNMPSYNDDNGDVIILNNQGNIVDELQYDDSWQFPLISNTEGVALERISYDAPTQLQSNWHSAATSVGYGTPTYKNSQYRIDEQVQGEITVTPKIVSPDNDGIDDFATIDYSFPQSGYVANITIFNSSGTPVRYLEQNALCGTKGNFIWDGLDDKKQKLAIGIYIVYAEVFDLTGKTKQFKNAIVLARKN